MGAVIIIPPNMPWPDALAVNFCHRPGNKRAASIREVKRAGIRGLTNSPNKKGGDLSTAAHNYSITRFRDYPIGYSIVSPRAPSASSGSTKYSISRSRSSSSSVGCGSAGGGGGSSAGIRTLR
jgi:hypothetical protein